ncbi:MAG: response regulator [Treponema sp.]|nr:response regulator [Treponema sp.]
MANKRKILIVDDEKINILALAHFLKSQYDIIVTTDSLSALETAEKHLPDLILLDVIMPDMNGYEVIQKLKESEIAKDIPVIFISGLNDSENEEKGIMLGAADFITKPFNKTLVKKRIETQIMLLDNKRIIDNYESISKRS